MGDLRLHISWETHEACLAVMHQRFPNAVQRGDLLRDNPDQVAQLVLQADPAKECLIIAASGPPCPDFSVVNSSALGREGPEGCKFVQYCDFIGALEAALPDHRIEHLAENVKMQDKSEIAFFSSKLRCSPILMDASDFGLVNRARLWWTKVDWTQVQNPLRQRPLRCTKQDKIFAFTWISNPLQHPRLTPAT